MSIQLMPRQMLAGAAIITGICLAAEASAAGPSSGVVKVDETKEVFTVGNDKYLTIKFLHETEARGSTQGGDDSTLKTQSRIALDVKSGIVSKALAEVKAEGDLIESKGNITGGNKHTYLRVLTKDVVLIEDKSTSSNDTKAIIGQTISREFFSLSGNLKLADFTPDAVDIIIKDTSLPYAISLYGSIGANNTVEHKKATVAGSSAYELNSSLSLDANLNVSLFGSLVNDTLVAEAELSPNELIQAGFAGKATAKSRKHSHEAGARTISAAASLGGTVKAEKAVLKIEGEVDVGGWLGDIDFGPTNVTLWNSKTLSNNDVFHTEKEQYLGRTDIPLNLPVLNQLKIVDVAPCKALKLSAQGSSSSHFERDICRSTPRQIGSGTSAWYTASSGNGGSGVYPITITTSEPSASASRFSLHYHDKYWGLSIATNNTAAEGASIQIQSKTYTSCGLTDWADVYTTVSDAKVFYLDSQAVMNRDVSYNCLEEDAAPENRLMYRIRYTLNGQSGNWTYFNPIHMRQD